MRLLHRGQAQLGVMYLPVLSIVVDLLPAPQQLHQLKRLLKPAHPVSPVGPKGGQLRYPVTYTHAKNESPVADVVQRYRLFGKVHRVVVGEQQNAGQKFQALSIGANRASVCIGCIQTVGWDM